MIRSLRWRMQAWHALILVLVLVVFGGVVYYLQWNSRIQELDSRLEHTGELLMSRLFRLQMPGGSLRPPQRRSRPDESRRPEGAGALSATPSPNSPPRVRAETSPAPRPLDRMNVEELLMVARHELARLIDPPPKPDSHRPFDMPPPPGERGPPPDRAPPPERRPPTDRAGAEAPPRGRRGRERDDEPRRERGPMSPFEFTRRRPGGPPDRPPEIRIPLAGSKTIVDDTDLIELGFPDELAVLFNAEREAPNFFVVWDYRGNLAMKTSTTPDEVSFPPEEASDTTMFIRKHVTRGNFREFIMIPRFGVKVIFGQSLLPELQAQQTMGLGLCISGMGIMLVGLIGGNWISGRAMAPLQQMTSTAEMITAHKLSERINVQETDSELGALANVLNQAFSRLQASFDQQARFTADASHELRTPVAILVSQTELTLSRQRSAAEYEEALQTCRRTALRMRSLVEGLLFLARFDAGESQVEYVPLDLGELARECMEDLKPLADEKQIHLASEISASQVRSDRNRITQVLTNLLTNAIRYNRESGRIQLVVRPEGNWVLLEISDTGIGIPAEDLPHVFERFYRVDKARTIAVGGTGLGLAICKTIIDGLGGRIDIESQVDRGTKVQVRLPGETGTSEPVPPQRQARIRDQAGNAPWRGAELPTS